MRRVPTLAATCPACPTVPMCWSEARVWAHAHTHWYAHLPPHLPAEAVEVRIPFPRCIQSADLRASQGTVVFNEHTKECVWRIGRPSFGKSPELTGTLNLAPTEMPPRGARATRPLRHHTAARHPGVACAGDSVTVSLQFEVPGASVSGLKVRPRQRGRGSTPHSHPSSTVD